MKYDLTPYLKSTPYILTSDVSPGILSSTPLSALISLYKEDAFYASAIAKKCIEENLPFFQEENIFCFYEQGNLCKVNFSETDQFRIQIENRIAEYPDFPTRTCSIQ